MLSPAVIFEELAVFNPKTTASGSMHVKTTSLLFGKQLALGEISLFWQFCFPGTFQGNGKKPH